MIKKSKIWFIFIGLILLIIFRFLSIKPVYRNGQRIRITATVFSDPIRYETNQYLRLVGLKVYLPLFPEISYGDRVVIEGVVDKGKLENASIQKIEETDNWLFKLRGKLISFYQSVFPEPYSGLVGGIVLGSKGGITNDFWEKVKKAGVAHVVVASGMNVTFVASFLMGVGAVFLPRRKVISFVILGIVLYVFISGLDAPLIRAAIMGSVAFGAQETGRLVTAWRALILSALVMLVINPLWISDIGFILSFVATASLLLFEKKVRKRLHKVPELLKEGLSTSLAAQIGVAPILFVTFGQFNILSPVINALVLWTIPYIMIFGAVGAILGLLMPFLGKIILILSFPFVWWFTSVVTLFSF